MVLGHTGVTGVYDMIKAQLMLRDYQFIVRTTFSQTTVMCTSNKEEDMESFLPVMRR